MAYEPKSGSFSLFKNDRKEKDTHPDYKGDGLALDGSPIWVSAWLKTGASGVKFMSCSIQPKEAAGSAPTRADPRRDLPQHPLDDDLDF